MGCSPGRGRRCGSQEAQERAGPPASCSSRWSASTRRSTRRVGPSAAEVEASSQPPSAASTCAPSTRCAATRRSTSSSDAATGSTTASRPPGGVTSAAWSCAAVRGSRSSQSSACQAWSREASASCTFTSWSTADCTQPPRTSKRRRSSQTSAPARRPSSSTSTCASPRPATRRTVAADMRTSERRQGSFVHRRSAAAVESGGLADHDADEDHHGADEAGDAEVVARRHPQEGGGHRLDEQEQAHPDGGEAGLGPGLQPQRDQRTRTRRGTPRRRGSAG